MKCFSLLGLFFHLIVISAFGQSLSVVNPKCEYRVNPLGVEAFSPRLSWQLKSSEKNVEQIAYQIIVSDNPESLKKGNGKRVLWNSGKVYSGSSIQVSYQGEPLQPAGRYYWRVKVWDNKHDSAWSKTSFWETGLFTEKDWRGAEWIAYNKMPDSNKLLPGDHYDKHTQWNDTLPLFRKLVSVKKNLERATVFISGLGQFELHLNGKKVGDHFLDPGWTQYEKDALYVTFDITKELNKGKNVVGVMLGNGFYYIPVWQHRYRKLTNKYGFPTLKCLIKLKYKDGSTSYITSNRSWKTSAGPIYYSSIYGGEDYNANLEQPGWDRPGFNDTKWRRAVVVDGPPELHSQMTEPIKVTKTFSPKKVYYSKDHSWVFDLGQNASGIPKITVKGHQGDTVKIFPAEVVNHEGVPNQKASGGPYFFTYILKGNKKETWQPRFSYYGFRYLRVVGAVPKGKSNPNDLPVIKKIKGLHIRNSNPKIGSFQCSNSLFNRTYHLIDWAIQNNMVSLFTDCPHREKLGWLEQMNLMGPSVHFTYDVPALFRRTIRNMKDAQTKGGLVPEIAPEYVQFGGDFRDSPEWGSSSIIVPWYMYKWYGDKRIIEKSYAMMKGYIHHMNKKAKNYILYYGLSDWYDLGQKRPGFSQLTPDGVTATAYFYYDLNLMQKIAALLNKKKDVNHYKQLGKKVRSAFNKTFFHEDSMEYATGSQTANAMAVFMDLVPSKYKKGVIKNIIRDIHNHNNTFTSGDIGFRYLLQVLDKSGHADLIYTMNNRTDVPGYGYQLKKGATALTESWLGSPSASNDHFMLGHIMEWFYSGIGGISQTDSSIAYQQVKIEPEVVGNITSARTHYISPYGKIKSKWNLTPSGNFELSIDIPANSSSVVILPIDKMQEVYSEDKPIIEDENVQLLKKVDGKVYLKTGSGQYDIAIK